MSENILSINTNKQNKDELTFSLIIVTDAKITFCATPALFSFVCSMLTVVILCKQWVMDVWFGCNLVLYYVPKFKVTCILKEYIVIFSLIFFWNCAI